MACARIVYHYGVATLYVYKPKPPTVGGITPSYLHYPTYLL